MFFSTNSFKDSLSDSRLLAKIVDRSIGALVVATVALSGCADAPTQSTEPRPQDSAYIDAVAPTPQPVTHYLTYDTTLRLKPTSAVHVANPFAKGKLVNRKGFVPRGGLVAILADHAGWTRIVFEDGTHGWVDGSALAEIGSVIEATVLEEAPVYQSASPTAARREKPLYAGSLLLVVQEGQDFSKVLLRNGEEAWVRSNALSRDPEELAVSRIIEKVMQSRNVGLGPFYSTLEKAKIAHPKAQLLPELERMVGLDIEL